VIDRQYVDDFEFAGQEHESELQWPAQDVGTAVLEVRMTGDFVLMTKKSYPAAYVTQHRAIEHQIAMEAHDAFGKLVNDNRFIFDPKEKRLTYRSMLVTQSTTPNTPASAIGVEMSSNSPIPKLRAEIRIPKLEGSIAGFFYVVVDTKIVVEITPKPRPPGPLASKKQLSVPEAVPSFESPWVGILGAGLVVTTLVLAFGVIADDVLPPGLADDAPGLAAAGVLLARGLNMMGATHANSPSTAMPAHVQAKATVSGPASN
jgi:hypothetical protein